MSLPHELKVYKVTAMLDPEQVKLFKDTPQKNNVITLYEGDCGQHRYMSIDLQTRLVEIEIPNFIPGIGNVNLKRLSPGNPIEVYTDNYVISFSVNIVNVIEIPINEARNVEGIGCLNNYIIDCNKALVK